MTGPGDSHSEMPSFPWPTRPDGRAFDALLSGKGQPDQAPAELRAVAEVFATLQAPADQREVASWGQALIAYREAAGLPEASSRSRSHRRKPRLIPAPLSTKLAAAAWVAAVAVLGGGIAAAYTDSLPGILQKVAHDTIAAPPVRETRAVPTPSGPVRPAGPMAAGSASYGTGSGSHGTGSGSHGTGSGSHGLCRAYQQAEQRGNADQEARAWRNLVNAAGGADRVAAYCAGGPHPGISRPSHGPEPATAPGHRNDGGNTRGR
jgi:hypothetical protein